MIDEQTVRKALRIAMNDLADALAGGGCEDYPGYRDIVGEIRGLARAERIVLDIVEAGDPDA